MYGDSRENLLEILAVVIIVGLISSVCGFRKVKCWETQVQYETILAETPKVLFQK